VVRAVARIDWVGVPPPYDVLLFFVRPKKTNEKKGRPTPAPFGFPALLARIGARLRAILARRRGQAIHGLSPAGLIRFGLRCSARQTGFQTRLACGIAQVAYAKARLEEQRYC
jgi:hypothetical protein